jgi:uncharacterized membrane protein YhaH (DUF805 family)
MFCTQCGNQLSDIAQFCSSCGRRVAERATPPTVVLTNGPSVATSQSAPSQPFVYTSDPVLPRANPQVEFGTAISRFFQNYANFNGRARRSEYWLGYLFVFLINLAILILAAVTSRGEPWGIFDVVYLIWNLAIFIPVISASVRRLHDVGRMGTYLWMSFIPFVGPILLIIKLAEDSQPGANQFGPSQKY